MRLSLPAAFALVKPVVPTRAILALEMPLRPTSDMPFSYLPSAAATMSVVQFVDMDVALFSRLAIPFERTSASKHMPFCDSPFSPSADRTSWLPLAFEFAMPALFATYVRLFDVSEMDVQTRMVSFVVACLSSMLFTTVVVAAS